MGAGVLGCRITLNMYTTPVELDEFMKALKELRSYYTVQKGRHKKTFPYSGKVFLCGLIIFYSPAESDAAGSLPKSNPAGGVVDAGACSPAFSKISFVVPV